MTSLIKHPETGLFERNGQAFASSQMIAESAEIQHASVVRLIDNYRQDLAEFGAIEFADLKSGNRKGGRPTRVYYLNEQQATLILTYLDNTEPVRVFKKTLVRAFFEMREFLVALAATRLEFPAFTAAVQMCHLEPKPYHFSNEINMLYRIIFGMDAKALRARRGIEAGESVRPHLTAWEAKALEALQRVDVGLLEAIPDYEQRKAALARYFEKIKGSRLLPAA